jgi:hypothetical protein
MFVANFYNCFFSKFKFCLIFDADCIFKESILVNCAI